MTTLLQSGARTCSQKCYLARGPECSCICQGLFHGRLVDGTLVSAIEETPQEVLDGLEKAGCKTAGLRTVRRSEDAREALDWEREVDVMGRTTGCGLRMPRMGRRGRKPAEGQRSLDFSPEEARGGPEEGCLDNGVDSAAG